MELAHEPGRRMRAASLLRAAANDLKRDDATAEADLGLPAGAFAELTSGRRRRSATLDPGDSCYVLPQVPIVLGPAGPDPGRVLLLRIGGTAGTDVRFALGTMAGDGIARYLDEDRLWYQAGDGDRHDG